MPKNIESINPFHEEVHEDEERIFKNDKQHNYVPPDQIPDPEPFDPFEKKIDVIPNTEFEEIVGCDDPEWEDKRKKELTQQIRYQTNDGVVSVGPNVDGQRVQGSGDSISEIRETGKKTISAQMDSHSPYKRIKSYHEIRKDKKTDKSVGNGGENLKTMSDSKKEKYSRGPIRKFIDNLFSL